MRTGQAESGWCVMNIWLMASRSGVVTLRIRVKKDGEKVLLDWIDWVGWA